MKIRKFISIALAFIICMSGFTVSAYQEIVSEYQSSELMTENELNSVLSLRDSRCNKDILNQLNEKFSDEYDTVYFGDYFRYADYRVLMGKPCDEVVCPIFSEDGELIGSIRIDRGKKYSEDSGDKYVFSVTVYDKSDYAPAPNYKDNPDYYSVTENQDMKAVNNKISVQANIPVEFRPELREWLEKNPGKKGVAFLDSSLEKGAGAGPFTSDDRAEDFFAGIVTDSNNTILLFKTAKDYNQSEYAKLDYSDLCKDSSYVLDSAAFQLDKSKSKPIKLAKKEIVDISLGAGAED